MECGKCFRRGGSWAIVAIAVHDLYGVRIADPLLDDVVSSAVLLAGIGALWGCLGGSTLGLRHRLHFLWPLGGLAFGALAGGALPIVVGVTSGWLSPLLASSLVMAAAGSLAGLAGYTGNLERPSELSEDEESSEDDVRPRSHRSRRRQSGEVSVAVRLLPVLLISCGCLVAVVITPASSAGGAVLAVGLLGFAMAWTLTGQELRIRELERKLREQRNATRPSSPR